MEDSGATALTDEALEDCLQAVHRLAELGQGAKADEVARFARLAPATAMAALRELTARGLIENGRPGALSLTAEGSRQAAAILRRHRLSERLFTDVFGFSWDRVHDEAMRLEHALTPDGEARLDALLNHPETCPHGAPIPAADGSLARLPAVALDQVPAGRTVWIQQILEEETAFLRHLASLGLLPRVPLTVEEVAPFGGPLLVQVRGARYAIGREVAARILVREE